MDTIKDMLYAQIYRSGKLYAFFWFTPYAKHLAQLCVIQYPNPLDQDLHTYAQLFLFLIAGFLEYLLIVNATDVMDFFANTYIVCFRLFLQYFDFKEDANTPIRYRGDELHAIFVSCFLVISFVRGFRSLVWDMRANAHRRSLVALAASVARHNPAAVYDLVLRIIPGLLGWRFMRVRLCLVSTFWILMSPPVYISPFTPGGFFSEMPTDDKIPLGFTSSTTWAIRGLMYTSLLGGFLGLILQQLSVMLLVFALTLMGEQRNFTKQKKCRKRDGMDVANILSSPACRKISQLMIKAFDAIIAYLKPNGEYVKKIEHPVLMKAMVPTFWIAWIREYLDRRSKAVTGLKSKSSQFNIRLLRLLPSASLSSDIQCELAWYNFNELPAYTALSYTWGTQAFSEDIIVNGKRKPVTKSAEQLLRHVRSFWRIKTLWIDAICINQEDPIEKANQIRLMPYIYGQAEEVIIFLGYAPPREAALAAGLVDRLFMINRIGSETGQSVLSLLNTVSEDAARALERMLSRPWFERTWVVQEVVRANNSVSIWYGHSRLDWYMFTWFVQSIQRDREVMGVLSDRSGGTGLESMSAFCNVNMLERFHNLRDYQQPLSLLFYLVQMFRTGPVFHAGDDLDRVFGLLGLSGTANIAIKPNYSTKTTAQVYTDVAIHSLTASPSARKLDFLAHAGLGFRSTISNLPTWVPDWTLRPMFRPLLGTEGGPELLESPKLRTLLDEQSKLKAYGKLDTDHKGESEFINAARGELEGIKTNISRDLFNATPSTEPKWSLLPDNVLEIEGYTHDLVFALGREMGLIDQSDWWTSFFNTLLGWIGLAQDHFLKQVSPQEMAWEEFIRTILHDVFDAEFDFNFAQAPHRGLGKDEIFQLSSMLHSIWRHPHPKRYCTELQTLYSDAEYPARLASRFVESCQRTCSGRVFGITLQGRMGLFLPNSAVGDEICLIHGASVPLTLRQLKTAESNEESLASESTLFHLVGPAYVNGIMYGEGLPTTHASQLFKIK